MAHLPEDDAIRAVLDALGRDEYLSEEYVLKGGNALRYAFFGRRASVDLDLSAKTIRTDQVTDETKAVLEEFCGHLETALEEVAPEYGFSMLTIQSTSILPPNRPRRRFPALEVSVGYSRRADRTPPFSDVVRLEVTLNEVVCEAEYAPLEGGAAIHVSSINDIIAEKCRALLQQPIRNRERPADVYDIWFYMDRRPELLDPERITRFLEEKTETRDRIRLSKSAFRDPDIRERAATDWDQIAPRLPAGEELPSFETAFAAVLELVGQLNLPEEPPPSSPAQE